MIDYRHKQATVGPGPGSVLDWSLHHADGPEVQGVHPFKDGPGVLAPSDQSTRLR